MFSIILQRNNRQNRRLMMGTGFYPDLLNVKAICPQHFPKQWQFFLYLFQWATRPQTILAVSATDLPCETATLSVSVCTTSSPDAPQQTQPQLLPLLALTYTPPLWRPEWPFYPFYIPCCWKAMTCYSRTEMAITSGAHSSNKRVSHLFLKTSVFPAVCIPNSPFGLMIKES